MKADRNEPLYIHSDDGRWVLADTEEQAREFARAQWGDDYAVQDDGWMHNIGWDRDQYERKRDFVAEAGYTSWWEGCRAPADGQPTKKCRRAFVLEARRLYG